MLKKRLVTLLDETRESKWRILLAVLFGGTFGLFVNGYWLIDVFPVGSTKLLLLTVLAGLLGAVGYFILLRQLLPRFLSLSGFQRLLLIIWSILLGLFLFFGGTSQWRSATRYVTFFLPTHRLQISVNSAAPSSKISLTWFSTSLGDVSYETIDYQGWSRIGDQIALENPSSNMLTWNGPTGENVQLVFRSSRQSGQAVVSWDGNRDTLDLTSGRVYYDHSLNVPWFASRPFVLALGIFNFIVLAGLLSLWIWRKRDKFLPALERDFSIVTKQWGVGEWVLLFGIIFVALLLRIVNLNNLFPAVDEYYHLIAARRIMEGAALNSVYQRSLWIVTLPVSVAFRLFGDKLWVARLVGAVVNVLAIFPLYLLTRKINRPVAVLSVFLYATSPWIIAFARIVREYAYYPFIFFWVIYGMIRFLEIFPDHFIFRRDWRFMLKPRLAFPGLVLLILPLYPEFLDHSSTFKVILIAYVVFAAFVVRKFDWKDKYNRWLLALLLAGVLSYAYIWFAGGQHRLVSVLPEFHILPIEYFFSNPQQQWYFDRLGIVPGICFVAALLICFTVRRVNFIALFVLTLYGCFLGFFVFFSKIFYHTRHLITTQLWFIILVAIGLYAVWRSGYELLFLKGNLVRVLSAVLLGLLAFNGRQVLLPAISVNPNMVISGDYHHDLSLVNTYMLEHVRTGDALVSTVYGLYTSWQEQPKFQAMYRFSSQTSQTELYSFVDRYPSGWIVIDQIRLDKATAAVSDLPKEEGVRYVGKFGDENVWYWNHASEILGADSSRGTR